MHFVRHSLLLSALLLLTGCALPGLSVPGLQLLVCIALLGLLVNCRPLLDENRLNEFWLRRLLLDDSGSGGSSGPVCTGTQDYTQSFDLSLVDPATAGFGFTITREDPSHDFGWTVAGGGDFNGDGIGDILVGGYRLGSNTAGRVYVLFGVEGAGADIATAGMATTTGITIDGSATGDYLGKRAQTLDFAGDVNGDGFDDIIVGTYYALGMTGSAFLIYGSASPGNVDLSAYTATVAARFDGAGGNYYAGYSAAGLGDVNGDGLDDFAIGHKYGTNDYGEVNVVFGTTSTFTSPVLTSAITGSAGFTVNGDGTGSYMGSSVSPAGDLNGDGLADVLLGAYGVNGRGAGYVIYGQSGFPTSI